MDIKKFFSLTYQLAKLCQRPSYNTYKYL